MKPAVETPDLALYLGDVLDVLPTLGDGIADACVTSPPYLDARPEYGTLAPADWPEFFEELRRIVAPAGAALFNVGRLWRDGVELDWWIDLLATAKRAGWGHLDTLVWVKPNANPIHGRVFTNAHEYVLVLGDPERVILNEDDVRTEYDPESLARFQRRYRRGAGVKGGHERDQASRDANEGGARARSFFIGYTGGEKGNPHPAPMTLEVAEHLVRAASFPGQTVIDPFMGSGTTALAARNLGRRAVGVELDPTWVAYCAERNAQQTLYAEGAA